MIVVKSIINIASLLQALRKSAKAQRECALHWMVRSHNNIVNVIDVYENTFSGTKCYLMVMEWYVKLYALCCVLWLNSFVTSSIHNSFNRVLIPVSLVN